MSTSASDDVDFVQDSEPEDLAISACHATIPAILQSVPARLPPTQNGTLYSTASPSLIATDDIFSTKSLQTAVIVDQTVNPAEQSSRSPSSSLASGNSTNISIVSGVGCQDKHLHHQASPGGGTKRESVSTEDSKRQRRTARNISQFSSASRLLKDGRKRNKSVSALQQGARKGLHTGVDESAVTSQEESTNCSAPKSPERAYLLQSNAESDDELVVAVPPRLNPMIFGRAAFGLPRLAQRQSTTSQGSSEHSTGSADIEGTSPPDIDVPAAERLRGGILKFRYQGGLVRQGSATLPADAHFQHTATRSESSSSRKGKGKRIAPIFAEPVEPVDLPADDRVKHLDGCPFCSNTWSASKTLASKCAHLRSCAATNEYTSETVRVLVENRLLALAKELEEVRADQQRSRTIFDHAVGVGEGLNQFKEVNVIGIEDTRAVNSVRAIDAWQQDLNRSKRRLPQDKLLKVARDIRRERRNQSLLDHDTHSAATQPPQSTGCLAPSSTSTRKATVERAGAVISAYSGTGLTQIPGVFTQLSAASASRVSSKAEDEVNLESVVGDSSVEILLPSTQGFPVSRVAQSLAKQRKGSYIARPSKPLSTGTPSEGGRDSDDASSLWYAASGKDEATINRVVLASRASSDNFDAAHANVTHSYEGLSAHSTHHTSRHSTPSPKVASSMKRHGFFDRESGLLRVTESADANESVVERQEGETGGVLVWKDAGRQRGTSGGREETIVLSDDSDVLQGISHTEAITSEEEPLITLARKRRGCRKSIHSITVISNDDGAASLAPSSNVSSPSEDESFVFSLGDKPDYDSWTTVDLKKEVVRFGYRRSNSRDTLLQRLDEVWSAMQAARSGRIATAGMNQSAKRKKANKPRKNVANAAMAQEQSDYEHSDGGETVAERLRLLLLADQELYSRILRYEPIYFEEIVTMSAENGIKAAKPLLMRCLDEQCITYFTQDPTNSSRRRRK